MWRRTSSVIAASAMAVLAVASVAVAVPAGAAVAASPDWTIQHSPNVTLPGGGIRSMSCASATSCVAVGSFSNASGITDPLAEAWNGTSWRKQAMPSPPGAISPSLLGVSCPAAGFCEAVGGYEEHTSSGFIGVILAESWNGASWAIQSVPSPSGSTDPGLLSLSCTSSAFCEAVGSFENDSGQMVPLAETWNGATWSVQPVPAPAGTAFALLRGVSCVSATFCEADGGNPAFADMWNGTSWAQQAMPGGGGAVSCVSSSFCMAVAGEPVATGSAIWNGSSWTSQPIQAPSGATFTSLGAVSCSSAQECEAVGSFSTSVSTTAGPGLAEGWNGTSWTVQSTPNPAGAALVNLNGVSCVAAGSCEAGGFFVYSAQSGNLLPVAQGWNGNSWVLQAAAAPPRATPNILNGVSCASATSCEAVGTAVDVLGNETGLAQAWDGTSWKIQPVPEPAQSSGGAKAIMNGVSCVSASFCEAVGFSAAGPGAAAWDWDGTSWTAQPVPGPDALESVSCPSAAFCMAVADNGGTDTWDGSTWSQSAAIPGSPFPTLGGVSCVSASFCEAIGAGNAAQEAAEWNGTAWLPQATPLPADGNANDLRAVSCVAADDCTAVGDYTQDTTFDQLTLAEHWDGSAWAVQSTPNPAGSSASGLAGIWCRSANFCAAVGDQQNSTTFIDSTLVLVRTGMSWTTRSSADRSPNKGDVLQSVWCHTGNSCTAVGYGADPGEVNATLVETGG
jgi:hypothetical protein